MGVEYAFSLRLELNFFLYMPALIQLNGKIPAISGIQDGKKIFSYKLSLKRRKCSCLGLLGFNLFSFTSAAKKRVGYCHENFHEK